MYYFGKDGQYYNVTDNPDWSGGFAIPVWNWTPAMWALIERTKPSKRYELANHFSLNIHLIDNSYVCKWCQLNKSELDGNYVLNEKDINGYERITPNRKSKPVVVLEPAVLDEGLKNALNDAVDHVKELHAEEIQATLDTINKEG
jgi:hypothetical protein